VTALAEVGPWRELLRARVDELGSIQAVADELTYSRTSISLALAGRYPAKETRLEAAVVTAYGRCACPYLAQEITVIECRRHRTRAMPQSDPALLRHWAACQGCVIGRRLAAAEALRREPC
jgi:hypothetical protein